MTLTSRQQTIQNQIDALDSSASTGSMLSLLNRAVNEGGIRWGYDSESLFPGYDSADLDSDYIGMFAFHDGDSDLWFHGQDLQWHKIDSAASTASASAFSIQGSTSAYTLGGSSPGSVNTIDKFSLTSDGNATDVGDLVTTRQFNTGGKSSSNAYTSGSSSPAYVNTTEKMPFASEGNTVAVPTMTLVATIGVANQEDISPSAGDYMYIASGKQSAPTFNNVIDKASTSSETAFTNVGNVFLPGYQGRAGHSSGTYGYLSGTQFYTNNIEKFSLTSDGNGTDVGNLLTAKGFASGSSSPTHGYNSGGYTFPGGSTDVIEKFSFSSDGNSTDVGNLLTDANAPVGTNPTLGWRNSTGHSSPSYGYHSGGTSPTADNTIQKYSFSSDGNSTDVGNLTVARGVGAGVAN